HPALPRLPPPRLLHHPAQTGLRIGSTLKNSVRTGVLSQHWAVDALVVIVGLAMYTGGFFWTASPQATTGSSSSPGVGVFFSDFLKLCGPLVAGLGFGAAYQRWQGFRTFELIREYVQLSIHQTQDYLRLDAAFERNAAGRWHLYYGSREKSNEGGADHWRYVTFELKRSHLGLRHLEGHFEVKGVVYTVIAHYSKGNLIFWTTTDSDSHEFNGVFVFHRFPLPGGGPYFGIDTHQDWNFGDAVLDGAILDRTKLDGFADALTGQSFVGDDKARLDKIWKAGNRVTFDPVVTENR
ncbi:MAG: hypothetical protein K2V38_16600, partial [Gemmataceae bacterium]|nr:hypothetical protein [Gemmataceae bacterium]